MVLGSIFIEFRIDVGAKLEIKLAENCITKIKENRIGTKMKNEPKYGFPSVTEQGLAALAEGLKLEFDEV